MSKVKAGSSSKNIHNNAGAVLVRQTGATKIAGDGTYMSRNYTIHAAKDGVVSFKKVKKQKFTGKTERRTQVRVD